MGGGKDAPLEQLIKDSLYWFVSDYAEVTVDWRIREGLDPALSFGTDIVMKRDLTDLRYLYAYGGICFGDRDKACLFHEQSSPGDH